MAQFRVRGESGHTQSCLDALDEILSGPTRIQKATILTKHEVEHLFVLWEYADYPYEGVIIPTGFASGYSGEGSRGFSKALCMISEKHIAFERLGVSEQFFDQVDSGYFPSEWQHLVRKAASECDMPVRGWVLDLHWDLLRMGQLWRALRWRWPHVFPEWSASADEVDGFSKVVGGKLYRAAEALNRDPHPETCQQVGLALRDSWIEFSLAARQCAKLTITDPEKKGRNDVKVVVEKLNLDSNLTAKSKRAVDSTLVLQHKRTATTERARACFRASVEAMSEIIQVRLPNQYDPRDDEWIRPS